MRYWLLKTEPTSYSLDDLKRDGQTAWDGVRNFQARNFLRDDMKPGDLVLIYYSSIDPKGVVGIGAVATESYPDESAFDPTDQHFDPKSSTANPTWFVVDIAYRAHFPTLVSLETIKHSPQLEGIVVAKTGSRLSVQPVSKEHFEIICRLGGYTQ